MKSSPAELVLAEAAAGDPSAAQKRIDKLDGIPYLNVSDEAKALAARLIADGGMPAHAEADALHVATASVHAIDYATMTFDGLLGGPGYVAAAGDYDGDWLSDPAVYIPAMFQENIGAWAILQSGSGYTRLNRSNFLGDTSWAPASADYDGDRKTDYAVYRETTGNWKVKLSSVAYSQIDLPAFLGSPGYSAVSTDYDGDGLADPAVYNRTDGTWKILLSGSGYAPVVLPHFLGGTGWNAVPGDYDGDGLADPAVRNADGSEWRIMLSGSGYTLISVPMGL